MGGKKKKHGRTGPLPLKPDSRLHSVQVESITENGVVVPQENAWATLTGVVRTDSGTTLGFPHPHIPGFYLTEAKRAGDQGRKALEHSLRHTRLDERTGTRQLTTSKSVIDAIRDLTVAVLLAVAGVEAVANECISRLDDEATVNVKRRGETITVSKESMERTLGLEEKIHLVVPLVSKRPSIKGTAPWEGLKRLVRMRNKLVHVKKRGYSSDPEDPSVFGQIILGKSLTSVDDALAVVDAAIPDILLPLVREELGMAPVSPLPA